jgi:hypothetical protein
MCLCLSVHNEQSWCHCAVSSWAWFIFIDRVLGKLKRRSPWDLDVHQVVCTLTLAI